MRLIFFSTWNPSTLKRGSPARDLQDVFFSKEVINVQKMEITKKNKMGHNAMNEKKRQDPKIPSSSNDLRRFTNGQVGCHVGILDL